MSTGRFGERSESVQIGDEGATKRAGARFPAPARALAVAVSLAAVACIQVLPDLPARQPPRPSVTLAAVSRAPAAPPRVARVDHEPVNDFEATLRTRPEKFGSLLGAAEALRLQVLYAEIVDDGTGKKTLRRHAYRPDAEYFYPASAIKLCAAIAALEKLSALRRSSGVAEVGVTSTARFFPMSDSEGTSSSGITSTIGQEVRGALVISENDSYNRLFAFVGHREINERMWSLGARSMRARHRVGAIPANDDARITPRVDVVVPGGKVLTTPKRVSTLNLDRSDVAGLDVGNARFEGNRRVDGPMSFATKNRISLRDLQDLLIKVVRPELLPGTPALELDDPERALLLDVLRTVPSESKTPYYTPGDFPDVVHKPLLPGLLRVLPRDRFALYSKGGRAFGFRVENAYVEATSGGGAFFLAVAMYADADGTVNDDAYDYEAIADPFLADLTELVARTSLKPGAGGGK